MIGISSVATAVPRYALTQADTKVFVSDAFPSTLAERFASVVEASRIGNRYTAVPVNKRLGELRPTERNEEYAKCSAVLAEHVASRAIAAAGIDPEDLGTVVTVSCTGYLMPSLDTYLIAKLGLNPRARRVPIAQLGCSAGVAAVGLAAQLLRAGAGPEALVVSVELCSLCLHTAEPNATDVMSSVLFGDGAAAVVLSTRQSGRPQILGSRSVLLASDPDALGMVVTDYGLRLVLSPTLPRLIGMALRPVVDSFLAAYGARTEELRFFVIHPGGPRILETVASTLRLSDAAQRPSWTVWERYGNVSSASVLFILKELQAQAQPRDGDLGLMIAFGPGVSCELVFLRWQGCASTAWSEEACSIENCGDPGAATASLAETQ